MTHRFRVFGLLVALGLLSATARAEGPPPAPAKPAAPPKDAASEVAVKSALRRVAVAVDLRAAAAAAAAAALPTTSPAAAPVTSTGPALATIGTTNAQASGEAGTAQEEGAPTATNEATAKVTKPAAGPRALRRMDAARVILSLGDGFRDCYARNNSRSTGSVVIRANTSGAGVVESTEVVSQTGLPLGVVQCVADRVREAQFRAPGGSGLAVLVPVRFGQ